MEDYRQILIFEIIQEVIVIESVNDGKDILALFPLEFNNNCQFSFK